MTQSASEYREDPGLDRRRWLILAAAIVMQLALGAVYAWSVFVKPLKTLNHWSTTEVSLTFTLAIFFLGIGSTVGGFRLDRVGPRLMGTIAGVVYGAGIIGASLATRNLTLLYLTYGVIGGLGLGLGYIVPVATLVKWFPDRRGLITGLAVGGFGAGALITAPVATSMIKSSGVSSTFLVLGIVYLVVVVGASQFYRAAPVGYRPAGWTASAAQVKQRANVDFTPGQALRRGQWYMLWAMLCLNVSAGIMLISQAAPIGIEVTHVSALAAAGLVGVIAIFNGAGRVFWGTVSDFIGRRNVFLTMFMLQAVLFLILPNARSYVLFASLAAVIALCYGGGFGTMPAFAADYFGPRFAGSIYGLMLTAWGVGGVIGPVLIAQVRDRTGGYSGAMYVIAGVMLISAALPLIVRPPGAEPEKAVGRAQPVTT
ncbi:MAG TPA: OFA family MFS transporter [Candidatus Dormibacteraeota bacterium]|nr:OFA family MFS transporter [Candidatus Dormibacteraeota bacterium]